MSGAGRPSIGQRAQGDASLGSIGGMPVAGPLGQPPSTDTPMLLDADQPIMSPNTLTPIKELIPETNNSSEATLVSNMDSDGMVVEDQPGAETKGQEKDNLNDKENLPPRKGEDVDPHAPSQGSPLSESSPSRNNDQAGREHGSCEESSVAIQEPKPEGQVEPPKRPPPVPPRPAEAQIIQEAIERVSQQQDVTEVINNVLHQLCCAIKPVDIADDGEQLDQIKTLFYGTMKTYTKAEGKAVSCKEERFSDLKVNVFDGPKDIYAALDGAFDVQQVDYEGAMQKQYASISDLPDILQVMVQRAQYDRTNMRIYKSNHHLALNETIYLDRYMDANENSSLMERRKECWDWTEKLACLQGRRSELEKGGPVNLSLPSLWWVLLTKSRTVSRP